ncbi:MAG: SxtJ family membrane protein [Candidatus Omnitrophota bacterium]
MDKINTDTKALRKFAFTLGSAFLIFALLAALRHKHSSLPAALLAAFFFIFGQILPKALKPVYVAWMRLALILNWMNTRLLLIIVFYLLITPIAVIMRAFGKDPLDRQIDRAKLSYWIAKSAKQQQALNYERQF